MLDPLQDCCGTMEHLRFASGAIAAVRELYLAGKGDPGVGPEAVTAAQDTMGKTLRTLSEECSGFAGSGLSRPEIYELSCGAQLPSLFTLFGVPKGTSAEEAARNIAAQAAALASRVEGEPGNLNKDDFTKLDYLLQCILEPHEGKRTRF